MGLKTRTQPNQIPIRETSNPVDGGENARDITGGFAPDRALTIAARLRPLRWRDVGDLVDAVEAAALDEDAEERFLFSAEISSTALDAYYTHMHTSTLQNFARDAAEGVALLDSHDGYKLGVGYSAGGRYEEENGEGRAVAVFYIVPGIRFGGKHSFASTDDYIRAVEGEVVRDVSVGFYGGQWVCDLCHQPYFGKGTACNHIAGWEYEIERDGKMEREVCTVTIHDAKLSEVSLVYDGATPGAMILKAEQEAEAGRLSPEMVRQVEAQYRVKLLTPAPMTISARAGVDGESVMELEEELVVGEGEVVVEQEQAGEPAGEELRAAIAEIRGAVTESAAPEGVELVAAVRWLNEHLAQATQERDAALASVAELQPLADQGRAYREELVNQAVIEGVRAMGEAFPEETYRAMLAGAPLDHIRQVRDTFAKQGAERFPGGRQTRDKQDEGKADGRRKIPAAAYGVK